MNKQEFLASIENNLKNILKEYLFNNYKNQVIAWKLSAEFTRTYDEGYLWNRALYLSTNSCILLSEDFNKRLALKALKESAEIYEYMSSVSEKYDKEYSLILSSLCYDLSGYQANALCLIKQLKDYEFQSTDERVEISTDNYILYHIKQILLKNIVKARATINQDLNYDLGVNLINSSLTKWYDNILQGTENDFLDEIGKTYQYFLNSSNLPVSHLLFLLKTRLKIYIERSIWENLRANEIIRNSPIWEKYIRLLTNDIYDRNKIKDIDKRTSKFEFWISQLRAVQSELLSDDGNYVIQMPTSTGKTFIAEIAILNCLVKYPDKKCIYIAPFRALTNEKEVELADYISKLGYSVSALSGSYEVDEFQDIILEDTNVLIATPEKIDLLLRLNPEYFTNISLIVVDEGQIVGDISARSSLLEFLIIRLRMKVESLKTLFISAVMPPANADEYSIWLSGQRDNVIRSLLYPDSPPGEQWEPTRKMIGNFVWEGNNGRINFKDVETEDENTKVKTGAFIPAIIKKRQFANTFPDGTTKAQTSASLAFELSKDGSCLVFCAKVKDTERVANAFLSILEKLEETGESIPDFFQKNQEKESFFFARKWFEEGSHITDCLERGIGIHFGDMPETVRKSVESDYESGNLKVLISTSTIGQGLNFPVKHLIIHSTIIGFNPKIRKPKKISVRDFWNIIGRAGRAGKETEGRIIFVINSHTDRCSYDEYTNKENIENAFSMFFNVLNALITTRINEETYENYVRILSEPYILNLLIEETVETDDEEIIEKIIRNSLFKVQLDERRIDIQPIRKSFGSIISHIREEVSGDLARVFGKTGFTLKSNQSIENFIELNKEQIEQIVNEDNYLALLELILKLFDEENIEEVTCPKLEKIGQNPSDYFNVIKLWVEGVEIDELQDEWLRINTSRDYLNLLISNGFYYRYTWGITSFITILLHKLDKERKDLPDGIKNLPSYIKYGLNNPTACLARSLGIKNRDTSILLADKANGISGREFIRWVANLTIDDVKSFGTNQYDSQNIINVAIKLTPNRYKEIPKDFHFYIRGIPFKEERKQTSLLIYKGDKLTYKRDTSNNYDPFAIKIYKGNNEIGFVPREFSKIISTEIDLNVVKYMITVDDVVFKHSYNDILITMEEIL